jgi:hypothetical protein
MAKQFRDSLSFVTMTFLVFILISYFMSTGYSTSANEDLSFGWLQLHRHGLDWSIEHFRFGILMLDVLLAIALTWIMSKVLRRRLR